jgi:FkbM family methyltransferase
MLGPEGSVIAVEADPGNFGLLERNVRENRISNIVTVHAAIWNREETLKLRREARQANSLVDGVVRPQSMVSVRAISVDALLDRINTAKPDLVSVTVNGAEVEVIEGMEHTLRNSEHLRLSVAGWYRRQDRARVCDLAAPLLQKAGYRVVLGRRGRILAWR